MNASFTGIYNVI